MQGTKNEGGVSMMFIRLGGDIWQGDGREEARFQKINAPK